MPEAPAIWLFDSHCLLCSAGVQYTLRHEKRASINFWSIQSEKGRALAQAHGVDPDDPTTFLFIEDGQALGKSDAIIALSRHLNGSARLVRITRILPRALRDAVYSVIARNRYKWFGKSDSCIVPSAQTRGRFIL